MAGLRTPSIGNEIYNDPRLDRVQDATNVALAKSTALPDSYGALVTATFTGGQTQTLAHKLGRAFQGWTVIRASGAAAALYEAATQPDTSKFIKLTSTNAGTYTIRVF